MSIENEHIKWTKRFCPICNRINNKLFEYEIKEGELEKPRKRFICNHCRKRFNRVSNTAVSHLKTDISDISKALKGVAKGYSVRDTADLFDFKPETIQRWIYRAGIQAELVMDTFFKNLDPEIIQLDEIWTYVLKRKSTDDIGTSNKISGTIWVWVAFIVKYRLIVAVHVGKRTQKNADTFIDKIFRRINPLDAFWTTDGLKQYEKALLKKYAMMGYSPDSKDSTTMYGRLIKVRKRGKMLGVSTEAVWGEMEQIEKTLRKFKQKVINTSYVERVNLTIRQEMSKLHRKQLTFAKTIKGLQLHISMYTAYYNFCRYHMSLKEKIPEEERVSSKKWNKNTPSMAANLTDHRWSVEELLLFQSGLDYDPFPTETASISAYRPIFRKPLPSHNDSNKDPVHNLINPNSLKLAKNREVVQPEIPFVLDPLVTKQIEQFLVFPSSKHIGIRYRDNKGVIKERTIEYEGFYFKNEYIYITGFCHRSKGHRTFRTDRIEVFNPFPHTNGENLLLPEVSTRNPSDIKPKKRRTFPSHVDRKVIFLPGTSSSNHNKLVLGEAKDSQEVSNGNSKSSLPIFLKGNPEAFLNLLGDHISLLIWQFLFWVYPDPQSLAEVREGTGYNFITTYDAIKRLFAYRMIELCTDPAYLHDKDPDEDYYVPIGSVLDNYLEPP